MTGARSPALGLALVLAALRGLPEPLRLLANMLLPIGWIPEIAGLAIISAVAALLQLAAGIACIRRDRAAPALLYAWAASTLVLAVCAGFVFHTDARGLELVAMLAETIGFPMLVLVVAHTVTPRESRAPIDVGAVLVGTGLASILGTPIFVITIVQMFRRAGSFTAGAVAGQSLHPAIALAIGVLAIVTGRRLVRAPAQARRLLRTYVILAIALHTALVAVSVVFTILDGSIAPRYLYAIQLISLVGGVGLPLTAWLYARDHLDSSPPAPTSHSAAWIALAFVPVLVGRVGMVRAFGEIVPMVIAAVIVGAAFVLGLLLLRSALGILRERSAPLATYAAAAITCLFYLLVVYATFEVVERRLISGPLAVLPATALTLAWLERHRRGQDALR